MLSSYRPRRSLGDSKSLALAAQLCIAQRDDDFATCPGNGKLVADLEASDLERLELATLFTPLLPDSIFLAEIIGEPPPPVLLQAEELALGRVGPKRLREFSKGRACARRALLGFGVEATPVLIAQDGAPLWPRGFVGSITHCPDYCVAAVGREAEFEAIGVDAEPHAALAAGVLEIIATPYERDWLRAHGNEPLWWDRILFSAKESAFKAGSRVLGQPVPFNDIEIVFDLNAGAFEAKLSALRGVPRLQGRFRVAFELIATTVIIPASSGASVVE